MLSLVRAMSRLATAFLFTVPMLSRHVTGFRHAGSCHHKKVYLLRGLTNVLSPGLDQLNEDLQRRNVDVTIANHAFSEFAGSRCH